MPKNFLVKITIHKINEKDALKLYSDLNKLRRQRSDKIAKKEKKI